ncbi:uncharacterized protein AKAW2_60286A [Aspergillus luchuensis]|uniref:Uncharacterized protein n=1 Tax=Aspergillus kawachii TaxID=1069201 RepID=A0A7R8A210_ASPKA|nr:uncharacterized protein AKAW2_60286A [Aspergillus luchuensis]BCS02022.1 hypothetical protein AKAW2_60286A [Aspergillus luchuensis]
MAYISNAAPSHSTVLIRQPGSLQEQDALSPPSRWVSAFSEVWRVKFLPRVQLVSMRFAAHILTEIKMPGEKFRVVRSLYLLRSCLPRIMVGIDNITFITA